MRPPRARSRAATTLALAIAGSVVLTATPATAAPNNNRAFQQIADQNGGTRASGLPGYTASSAYVHDKLAAAGWNVSYQDFDCPFFQQGRPGSGRVRAASQARLRHTTADFRTPLP